MLDFVAQSGEVGLRQLAQQVGFPPATVHRILAVLVRRGYVKQDPATRQYRLSLKPLELSSLVRERMDIVVVARPLMRHLMETTGETSNLVIFDNMEAVYVEQVTNVHSLLRMFTQVGARVPLYCSGVGKAYLALLPQEQALEYFRSVAKKKHTANTIVEEDSMLAELESIRQKGFSLDQEEVEEGVGCVAAVVNSRSRVLGAISISGPSSRVLGHNVDRLARLVMDAAESVAQGMGFAKVSGAA